MGHDALFPRPVQRMQDSTPRPPVPPRFLKGILPIDRLAARHPCRALARIDGYPASLGLCAHCRHACGYRFGLTAFIPLTAFALFGASRHLVVAADSATATIFASRVSTIAPMASAEYVELASMVALLTAALLLLARLFRLGFLADFLSRTVLAGFLAGVGIQVSIAMLGDILGMTVPVPSSRSLAQLWYVVDHIVEANLPTLALSLLVIVAILGFRRIWPRVPIPLVAVIGSILASKTFGFAAHGIAVLGPVAGGLPPLRVPHVTWQQFLDLVPVAASCFVMIVAQSAAAARVFAQQHHESADTNGDLLGLAAANAAAAFSGAFVVNGSPTQTAMADRAGARSQIAQLTFAAVVVVVLMFLSGFLQYLPHCVLAAIVFTIAVGLVNVQSLQAIRRESPANSRWR